MKFFVVLCFIFFPVFIKAQENNAFFIPDSLRKDADVVKRNEEYILTIKSPAKYALYERHVYTILNPSGSHYADYVTNYDKSIPVNATRKINKRW